MTMHPAPRGKRVNPWAQEKCNPWNEAISLAEWSLFAVSLKSILLVKGGHCVGDCRCQSPIQSCRSLQSPSISANVTKVVNNG